MYVQPVMSQQSLAPGQTWDKDLMNLGLSWNGPTNHGENNIDFDVGAELTDGITEPAPMLWRRVDPVSNLGAVLKDFSEAHTYRKENDTTPTNVSNNVPYPFIEAAEVGRTGLATEDLGPLALVPLYREDWVDQYPQSGGQLHLPPSTYTTSNPDGPLFSELGEGTFSQPTSNASYGTGPSQPSIDGNISQADIDEAAKGRPPYVCPGPTCKISPFNIASVMKKHARIHLPKDNRPFPCETCIPPCGETFVDSRMRTRHYNLFAKIKSYQCGACDAHFGRPDHLKRHQKSQMHS